MTCLRCRTANPQEAKFCLGCGAPLKARCEACGAPLPAAARFCLECAHPVGGAPLPALHVRNHRAGAGVADLPAYGRDRRIDRDMRQ